MASVGRKAKAISCSAGSGYQPSVAPSKAFLMCPPFPHLSCNRMANDLHLPTPCGSPTPPGMPTKCLCCLPTTAVSVPCQAARKTTLTGGPVLPGWRPLWPLLPTPCPPATQPAVLRLQDTLKRGRLASRRAACLTLAASHPGSHLSPKPALCSDHACKTEELKGHAWTGGIHQGGHRTCSQIPEAPDVYGTNSRSRGDCSVSSVSATHV